MSDTKSENTPAGAIHSPSPLPAGAGQGGVDRSRAGRRGERGRNCAELGGVGRVRRTWQELRLRETRPSPPPRRPLSPPTHTVRHTDIQTQTPRRQAEERMTVRQPAKRSHPGKELELQWNEDGMRGMVIGDEKRSPDVEKMCDHASADHGRWILTNVTNVPRHSSTSLTSALTNNVTSRQQRHFFTPCHVTPSPLPHRHQRHLVTITTASPTPTPVLPPRHPPPRGRPHRALHQTDVPSPQPRRPPAAARRRPALRWRTYLGRGRSLPPRASTGQPGGRGGGGLTEGGRTVEDVRNECSNVRR